MTSLVPVLEPVADCSPLASARARRQLTLEEAARRVGLTTDEVGWLEEGRLYRFPSPDTAALALLLYATGLGIDRREARRLAGLPVPPRPLDGNAVGRLGVVLALALVAAALVAAFTLPGIVRASGPQADSAGTGARGAPLPKPWEVKVDVLNGAGDISYTRRVASRIGALAYEVRRVARADRFDYPETAVYFPPGAQRIAERLAGELGVDVRPLPGGKDPSRLVVIVGPARIE